MTAPAGETRPPGPAAPPPPETGAPGPDPLHHDPEVWAPRLARVLDRQRDLYLRLDSLSDTQSGLIRSDQTDALLEVLGRRQQIVDELVRLGEDVAPFIGAWERLAPALPDRHREALRARFDEVAALVDRIAGRDEADRKMLQERCSAAAEQIGGLSRARGAVSAYGAPPQPQPRFQDSQA
jgi:hypothetical protein